MIDSNSQKMKFGTERCARLLKACGSPDLKLKIIHIAGSNGKGSTAAYITHIIAAAGKRVGTYTSPAVFSREEKILIDCKPIAPEKLDGYLKKISGLATGEDRPTAFEIETAAALYAFFSEGCEYAVVECGLGGKDDATNAIAKKELAVITSISLEHTAELGDTIQKICAAKAGIVKNCPCVVSALQPAEASAFFKNIGAISADQELTVLPYKNGVQPFIYGGQRYEISLFGREQCHNAAAAITACKLLGFDQSAIRGGLKNARLAGRCEIITASGKTYVLDGAHNAAAFAPLTALLGSYDCKKSLVFSCLSDKDVQAAADILSPYFGEAITFKTLGPRAMEIEKILNAFNKKLRCVTAADVAEALDTAGENFVVVCGSFTHLKEAKEWIEKRQ